MRKFDMRLLHGLDVPSSNRLRHAVFLQLVDIAA
jgi:hypothetical protein